MQVSFTFRQFSASDDLKALIEEKIDKRLGHLVNGETEVRVTLATEKAWTHLEMVVNFKGDVFKSEEKTTDLYPVIDQVLDRIERQILKHKEMIKERHRRV